MRTEAFNRNMAARHGYCHAVPFLVIGDTIWDGEHGAFLYAQMDLVGFDDWNVVMLAAAAHSGKGFRVPQRISRAVP